MRERPESWTRLGRRFAGLLAVLVGAGALYRSSRSEEEAFPGLRWSLLARAPDAIWEQAGALLPDRSAQWASRGLQGWDGKTVFLEGEGFVWSGRTAR